LVQVTRNIEERDHWLPVNSVYRELVYIHDPVPKKDGGADESLSWVDVVKVPSGFRNVPQYVDPHKRLVTETQVESEKMEEMCDSVGILLGG
jgi:hypothetical protein